MLRIVVRKESVELTMKSCFLLQFIVSEPSMLSYVMLRACLMCDEKLMKKTIMMGHLL